MDNFKLVHYYLSYEIRGGATRSTGAEEHADYRKKSRHARQRSCNKQPSRPADAGNLVAPEQTLYSSTQPVFYLGRID
jgi:hypothetical protein